ncbi:hypothetical protein [Anaeromassilibacillus senegalensis]|nr:hypothetical protein [Anaeromassilibacillus senegalensis]
MNQIRLQLLGIAAILFGIALILASSSSVVIGVILAIFGFFFTLAGASGKKDDK